MDAFLVLGLARRYAVDIGAAEAGYKQLSRQVHPDRFAKADPRARRAALDRTVQLNDAWRTIKDPVRRAEYLLTLAGVDVGADDARPRAAGERVTPKLSVPPAFLMEILELRDDLTAAHRARDAGKVMRMASAMRARADEAMRVIAAGLEAGTPGGAMAASEALGALRYYQRFLDEAEAFEPRAAEPHHA